MVAVPPTTGVNMATIYQRKSGNWTAEVRRNGQRLVETFSTRKLAEQWARGIETDIERGKITQETEEAKRLPIEKAAAQFAEQHLARLRHGARENNRLKALLDATGWGSLSLAELGPKEVSAYVRKREAAGCKPDTIRLDLALLSRLFRHARQEWGMESIRNPVDAVRRPSLAGTARTRRLEEGEEEKLLQAAHDDLRPVILWALATAMRREEIATLTWEDIDQVRRTAHLPKTKNGEARTVPLSPAALDVLRGIPRRLDGGPVFSLSKDQITDRMRVTVKRAGLANLRFHDLRHEATSRFFERGELSQMEIAMVTGHKTLLMLRRYTHLRAQDLAEKMLLG